MAVPAAIPDTTPEASTLAMLLAEELHAPPLVALFKAVIAPAHTTAVPFMVPAVGSGFTVTACAAFATPQLLVTVYDIVAVPAAAPVTTPPLKPRDAMADDELHAPPLAASVKVTVAPAHNDAVPFIVPAFGSGLTVTTLVAFAAPQLLVTVYDIVAVPAAAPVTTPPLKPRDAMADDELHAPPLVASVNVTVAPAHNDAVPFIVPAFGMELTVTSLVALAVPQLLVTVYDMVAVPAAEPVRLPVKLMDAIAADEELHTPLPAALLKVTVVPTQIPVAPLIAPAAGNGFIVTPLVAYEVPQLLAMVYVIFALPWATPVATPVAFTVTTLAALVLQVPPLIDAV